MIEMVVAFRRHCRRLMPPHTPHTRETPLRWLREDIHMLLISPPAITATIVRYTYSCFRYVTCIHVIHSHVYMPLFACHRLVYTCHICCCWPLYTCHITIIIIYCRHHNTYAVAYLEHTTPSGYILLYLEIAATYSISYMPAGHTEDRDALGRNVRPPARRHIRHLWFSFRKPSLSFVLLSHMSTDDLPHMSSPHFCSRTEGI